MKQQPCRQILPAVLTLLTLACATFTPAAAPRQATLINNGWRFAADGDTVALALPHTWNGDAYHTRDYRRGTGTYLRRLTVPATAAGRRIYLKLDGAANRSVIEIDGREAGRHVGAYSSHTADITDFVTPGRSHELKVTVDNADRDIPPSSADFTFMGGLYRDAWLIAGDPVHLDIMSGPECGFKATPHIAADGSWQLDVSGAVMNDTGKKARINVKASLTGPDGQVMASKTADIKIPAKSAGQFVIKFDRLGEISLWSPENPALYRVTVETVADGKVTDSGESSVGFRTFGFDGEGRFLLNGRPYKLRGMCRHQDQRPMGIALTDEQHRRDIAMIKDLGANFIRISHYPQDDAVLEMCDHLGLIAWEEIPVIDYVPDSQRFADNCETMLREMIRRHYNHPSVVMWGYMNEILIKPPRYEGDMSQQRALGLGARLEQVLHDEDSLRLSTMAFHGSDIYNKSGMAEIADVRGWNLYQGWYGGDLTGFEEYMSRQHREHPHHPLIVSEYGAGSDRRLHSLDPEVFDFSIEYQQKFLEHYLPVIEDSVFIAGASHWNFIDFSAAHRGESMPHINNKGLVSNDRRPKDVYYYYKAAWHDIADGDTVAHIAARDWATRTDITGADGTVTRPVKVYTNLPRVVMAVDGRRLAAQDVANCHATFMVPLHAGRNVIELYDAADTLAPLDAMVISLDAISAGADGIDPGDREFAVNVGSNCYFRSDDSGLTWLPDRPYTPGGLYGHTGGRRASTTAEIALTADDPLYQHTLNALDSYRIDVVPGRYEVELSFADLAAPETLSAYMLGHGGATDSAVSKMDIAINGRQVESGFAPAGLSGVRAMVKRRYVTDVTDGNGITVTLTPAEGATTSLATIKIRKTDY